jgi:hypothetical protein
MTNLKFGVADLKHELRMISFLALSSQLLALSFLRV